MELPRGYAGRIIYWFELDAVLKQDRFKRLRRLGNDLLLLLCAVEHNVVEIILVDSRGRQVVSEKLCDGNLQLVGDIDQKFEANAS